jgi:SPP1 gp7 family putative phage head morphogenesis protein
MLPELQALEDAFVASFTAAEAPYIRGLYQAWLRGTMNAAGELGDVSAIADSVREGMLQQFGDEALAQVRVTTVRSYRADIVEDLKRGAYDGINPTDVARQLRNRFDVHNYDWERLASSELTAAHARGKMDEYSAQSIEQYNYTTANDSKVSSICRANAAGGPYALNEGPLPMTDSHPGCRCTVTAVVE